MKGGITLLTVALLIALVWASGCADVSFGSQKIGDFGTTKEELKAVDHFIKTHGDPRTNSGPPRFVEPMVTTELANNTPVDKVTKFSKDTGSIFFWVFYDNFKKGDKLTLTWTFNGKTIITLERQAGGDFGRAFGEFLKPDKGWATGTHTITITGGGALATATFEIIEGPTQTVPLPYEQEGYPVDELPAPTAVMTLSGSGKPVLVKPEGRPVMDYDRLQQTPRWIAITSPKEGDEFFWGDSVTITWNPAFTSLKKYDTVTLLAVSSSTNQVVDAWNLVPNSGTYNLKTTGFTCPQSGTQQFFIRIYTNDEVYNGTSGRFTIRDSRVLPIIKVNKTKINEIKDFEFPPVTIKVTKPQEGDIISFSEAGGYVGTINKNGIALGDVRNQFIVEWDPSNINEYLYVNIDIYKEKPFPVWVRLGSNVLNTGHFVYYLHPTEEYKYPTVEEGTIKSDGPGNINISTVDGKYYGKSGVFTTVNNYHERDNIIVRMPDGGSAGLGDTVKIRWDIVPGTHTYNLFLYTEKGDYLCQIAQKYYQGPFPGYQDPYKHYYDYDFKIPSKPDSGNYRDDYCYSKIRNALGSMVQIWIYTDDDKDFGKSKSFLLKAPSTTIY